MAGQCLRDDHGYRGVRVARKPFADPDKAEKASFGLLRRFHDHQEVQTIGLQAQRQLRSLERLGILR